MKFEEILRNVERFMIAGDQEVYTSSPEQNSLYINLIEEEYCELIQAIDDRDDIEILDGCCDLLWVCAGSFISGYGEQEKVLGAFASYDSNDTMKKIMDDGPKVKLLDLIESFDCYINEEVSISAPYLGTLMTMVVLYALSKGYDIDGAFNEVTRSNMSKMDPTTGRAIKREDGKILKPDTFSPPNLEPFINKR